MQRTRYLVFPFTVIVKRHAEGQPLGAIGMQAELTLGDTTPMRGLRLR